MNTHYSRGVAEKFKEVQNYLKVNGLVDQLNIY